MLSLKELIKEPLLVLGFSGVVCLALCLPTFYSVTPPMPIILFAPISGEVGFIRKFAYITLNEGASNQTTKKLRAICHFRCTCTVGSHVSS